jgi:serine/threonine protein kinase
LKHAGDSIKVGDVIADKYRVERVLGRGGMGVVVEVWHLELHERRAIKFMLAKAALHAEAVERFLREARAAARLKSAHAVKIHDVARLPTGVPYIVMEYLEGQDLEKLLESRGPLSMEEACRFLLQACEAIGEAHALGIVHRDLKPANLFITKGVDGAPFVKVLDFGIAKVARDPDDVKSPSITIAHKTMGTPAYMSPEHVSNSKTVDGRADIWSLGVILYQLTTCSLPFAANHPPLLYAKILDDREMAPPPSGMHSALTPEFDAVVLRCLDKNLQTRYQTITQLVEAMTPFTSSIRPRLPSSLNPMVTVGMETIPLARYNAAAILAQHARQTIPSGPPLGVVGPTLPGGMARTTQPRTSTRTAVVISAIVGSLITGLIVWMLASSRHEDVAAQAPLSSAVQVGAMPLPDKPTSGFGAKDAEGDLKPQMLTQESSASLPTVAPEAAPATNESSAPAVTTSLPQSAPKSTGTKKQSTKPLGNKEFSTRK